MRFSRSRALLAALALVVGAEVAVIAPRFDVLALVAALVWMAAPGVALVRCAVHAREPTGVAGWLIGPAIGIGLSVFGVFLLWAVGIQSWLGIAFGPGLTWLAAAAARRSGGPTLRLPRFSDRDIVAVSVVLLVVPLVTWAPYDHVRERVAEGDAYRAYFTADFVWAMTVTAELAKGDVPPANPFLSRAPLRYYWLSHMLSGALYRNVSGWGLTAEQVILIDGLAFGLAAVALLYALARLAGGSPVFAALAVVAGFTANSYEGINRLWVLHQQHASYETLKTLNIDAVTRWFYQGMPVDGLQRMLLYQPHHLTGYVMGLSALWLIGFAEDLTETSVSLWTGLLLGLSFLFSTFTAIIIGIAAGAVFAAGLMSRRAWDAVGPCALLGGVPVLVAVVGSIVLGYTDPSQGSLIVVGPNAVAFRQWPLMLFLSFGPLLLAGLAGLARFGWTARDGSAAAMLVLTAFGFYFFTDVPDQQGVWVGWRSGHLLLIGFSVSAAAALTAAWSYPKWRVALAAASLLAATPAVPTVAIDVYNAQDIANRTRGPNFPWTLIVTPAEREALDWLRTQTAPDAIVQFEPHARGAEHWCYLTAFGERRMAAGLPGSMIPFKPFQLASDTVRDGIFKAATPDSAYEIARYSGINYLFVGPIERRAYRSTTDQMAKRPDLFPRAFHNAVVTIYAVAH